MRGFNRIWFFWREIFHPDFYSLSYDKRKILVDKYIESNYFTHFTSQIDVIYI